MHSAAQSRQLRRSQRAVAHPVGSASGGSGIGARCSAPALIGRAGLPDSFAVATVSY